MPAALAVVLLIAGQLVALAHEAAVRHAVCREHGELLDAADVGEHRIPSDHAQWVAVEGQGGHHADCTIARLLEQSTTAQAALVTLEAIAQTTELAARPPDAVERARELYLIAPKTSPPA